MKNKKTYLILAGVAALGVFLWMRGKKTAVAGPSVPIDEVFIKSQISRITPSDIPFTRFTPTIPAPKINGDPLNIPLDYADIRQTFIPGESMGSIYKPNRMEYDRYTLNMQI